jgi:hypothetical protein
MENIKVMKIKLRIIKKIERWTKLQILKSKPLENALIFKIRKFFLQKITFAHLSNY